MEKYRELMTRYSVQSRDIKRNIVINKATKSSRLKDKLDHKYYSPKAKPKKQYLFATYDNKI